MKVIGDGSVVVYDRIEERPHAPGPQETWQESIWLHWWDYTQGIGGCYRIGHETNWKDGPKVATWHQTYSPEGCWKETTYLPLKPEYQSPTRIGGANGSVTYEYGDHCVFTFGSEHAQGELHFHDDHPPIDCYPKTGQLSEFAPKHIEVAGSVSGRIAIHGRQYEVKNALAFRDHGWGQREWGVQMSHRWVAGVFGPELSFCVLTFHSSDDYMARLGWVVRHDELTHAKEIDVITELDVDGLSLRGGRVILTLTTGERIDLRFDPIVPGALSYFHGSAVVDTLCRTEWKGKLGIADFEICNNPLHGTREPRSMVRGLTGNGWFPAG